MNGKMHSTALHLDDMALFVEVARSGNFSKASERLGIANATLSRRVAAMEKRLGVRLFERSTRHMALTEPARQHLERCAPLVDAARAADAALRVRAAVVEGHVRVSMPVDLGTITLGRWLPEFLQQHPAITLDLDMSPRVTDLRTEPFDLAFRLGPIKSEGLVARRMGQIPAGLFAAPAYLETRGHPKSPPDLAQHSCLHIGSVRRAALWHFVRGAKDYSVKVRGPVAANNMRLMHDLAERGVGIALLPLELAQPALKLGALVEVLPHYVPPHWTAYAVTTSRTPAAPVRALAEFFNARMPRH